MTVAEAAGYTAGGDLAPARRRWHSLRLLLGKKLAVIAMVYLAIFYSAGIFAPLVAPQDPNLQHVTVEDRRQPPSSDHWLGTDALGRDLFSRVLYAARTTIVFTIVVVATGSLFLGLGLGLLAGYRGGWVDTAIMRTGEVLAGLPTLLLMLAIAAAFRQRINDVSYWLQDHTWLGNDAKTLVKFTILVGATVPFAWIGTSRIVRSQVLAIREATYISAAEAMGASTWRIVFRHVLPGVLPIFLVGLSSGMAAIAGAEVSLSYIGLGIDPPTASFGNLIADAGFVRTFQQYPHMLLGSAIPVILFFYSWNLLGDAMVDLFEPRTQRR
jgi:ABC-type dipeptide/oligopeptide/nickel transport system permease subunit